MKTKVVLLDRDGVVIVNSAKYITTLEDVEFIPGSVEAVRLLAAAGYAVALVTNQACVGKGMITMAEAWEIQSHVESVLSNAAGVEIRGFICPHRVEDLCGCRKPLPGLLTAALEGFGGGVQDVWVIGDAVSDLRAGRAVGAGTILVQTGRGTDQFPDADGWADHHSEDLMAAAAWLTGEL